MSKTMKRPLRKGVAKVPLIMQMEELECGAACLTMVMAYYGKWIPLEQVRRDCGVSRDGANAKNMMQVARSYRFVAEEYICDTHTLQNNGGFPCIIQWNSSQFVVLKGFKKETALINDPARGVRSVPMEEFYQSFTGSCLKFQPETSFVPEGKPKSVWAFAAKRLKGTGAAIPFTVICSLIIGLENVIQPGFARVFMDRLLTGENPEWFYPLLAGLALVSVMQILGSAICDIYSNKIYGKLAVVSNSTFFWKILHMPMEFFSQRMTGDIQNRQNSNSTIAGNLVVTVAPLAMNLMMVVFYLVVMLRYSVMLTLVGVASILINTILSRIISNKRINITRVQMRDSGKLSGTTVAGIEMIETIKASGAENGFFDPDIYWNIRGQGDYSGFVDRNMFFDKMRFMVFEMLAHTHRNFRTDYIDLYQVHNPNAAQLERILAPGGAMEAMQEAKVAGKIGHIGITLHSLDVFKKVLEYDWVESVMYPYNIVENQGEETIAKCAEKNIGFIAMKPLAGGALEDATLALRFICANPNVSVVIPGMAEEKELKQNLAAATDAAPLSAEELNKMDTIRKELGNNFCRRCGYCAPCTMGIGIPAALIAEGYSLRYGLQAYAEQRYAASGAPASSCVDCGLCEERCPYHLPIRQMLKRVVQTFGK